MNFEASLVKPNDSEAQELVGDFTFEPFEEYKQKVEQVLEKLKDPHYLPSLNEVSFLAQIQDTIRVYGEELDTRVTHFLDDAENLSKGSGTVQNLFMRFIQKSI